MHDNEPTASEIDLPKILAEVARRDGDRHAPRPMARAAAPGAWPVRCKGCGAAYDHAAWEQLVCRGVQLGYGLPDTELRDCPCLAPGPLTTLCVALEPEAPEAGPGVPHAGLGRWPW